MTAGHAVAAVIAGIALGAGIAALVVWLEGRR